MSDIENDLAEVRQIADISRFLLEVGLNCIVTTMVHYDLGWDNHYPAVGDVVEITNRWRERGVIK